MKNEVERWIYKMRRRIRQRTVLKDSCAAREKFFVIVNLIFGHCFFFIFFFFLSWLCWCVPELFLLAATCFRYLFLCVMSLPSSFVICLHINWPFVCHCRSQSAVAFNGRGSWEEEELLQHHYHLQHSSSARDTHAYTHTLAEEKKKRSAPNSSFSFHNTIFSLFRHNSFSFFTATTREKWPWERERDKSKTQLFYDHSTGHAIDIHIYCC